ncbi:helix-turn-helix domain-containing protein [Salipaludibacillus sp. CF4.18]|uniref:helix-turn-helix domain-containing protein n=1 Tax=Salipaludibacillus sp. CF4.18 TaxID=3373081 RepID=UPI003EE4B964
MEEKEILNTFNSEIGRNIHNKRRLLDLTLEDLAEFAELNNDHISDIEKGRVNMSLHTLMKICAGLQLNSPAELLKDAEEELYPLLKEIAKERKDVRTK